MLKGLLSDLRPHHAPAATRAATPDGASKPEQADHLAVATPTPQEPPTPAHPQLAALHLPMVRKRNSPPGLDAQLRRQVLGQVGDQDRSGRLSKLRTMALTVDSGETFTASSYMYGGTYGAVSLAIDGAGQPWAVKVLRTQEKNESKTALTRPDDFAKELAFTQKYVSSNAYAAADEEGELYLFLPLQCASAHEAAKALRQDPAAHRAMVRSVGAQVAHGLAFMHQEGDVMLDLKPGNIMIDHAGRATMSDFGEAQNMLHMQAQIDADNWTKPGTELFCAPELHRAFNAGDPLGRLSALDMWSFGMTLLDMTCDLRQGPFHACVAFRSTAVLDDYFAWRAARMGPNGFDMTTLEHAEPQNDPRGFTSYFKAVAARDPVLCHLLLSNVLCPEDARIDAPTARDCLRSIQPETSEEDALAHAAMVELGRAATVQAAVLAALHKRREVEHAAPSAAVGAASVSAKASATKRPFLLRVFEFARLSIGTHE